MQLFETIVQKQLILANQGLMLAATDCGLFLPPFRVREFIQLASVKNMARQNTTIGYLVVMHK